MKALCAALALALLLAVEAQPQAPMRVRFEAVDIVLDSGDLPLAAYQFEFTAETGQITIVGIEGGDHPAFKEPPYYDPAALRNNRVIIAAFSTAAELPTGPTRVARAHVQVTGDVEPQYVVSLKVAASADGERIPAVATATLSKEEVQ
jgi:hypothetical protein